jgi:hypothetical protein
MTEQPDEPQEGPGEPAENGSTTTSSPEDSPASGGQSDSPPAQGEGEPDSW